MKTGVKANEQPRLLRLSHDLAERVLSCTRMANIALNRVVESPPSSVTCEGDSISSFEEFLEKTNFNLNELASILEHLNINLDDAIGNEFTLLSK